MENKVATRLVYYKVVAICKVLNIVEIAWVGDKNKTKYSSVYYSATIKFYNNGFQP